MGTLPIILLSPHLYFLPGILRGQEPTLVQALLPKSSVKSFDKRVVRRLPGAAEIQSHATKVAQVCQTDVI